jgi:hypothetical protein
MFTKKGIELVEKLAEEWMLDYSNWEDDNLLEAYVEHRFESIRQELLYRMNKIPTRKKKH